MQNSRLISIVVIGRNEGARLERCLHSLTQIERSGFLVEVFYVDSGSTDSSIALASAMGATTLKIESPRPTAAMGRNAGWRAARGEIVLFLDGDTVLAADFISASLPSFDDEAVAVVWGHRRELYPQSSLYNRVLDLDWIYPAGDTVFCGGDALFRRSVLAATRGFDELLIAGEEPELCRRVRGLGFRIVHVDRAMTGHDLAITTFRQYWQRATRAGHAFAEVSERFRGSADPFWLEDARRNRLRGGLLLALPLAVVVASPAFGTTVALATCFALVALVVAKTALKARWKTRNGFTLFLYALHSHFQQVPIVFGQMRYFLNRRRGRRTLLVEYK